MSIRIPASLQAWRKSRDTRKDTMAIENRKVARIHSPAGGDDAAVYAAGLACACQTYESNRR